MPIINRTNKGSLIGTVVSVDALTQTVRFASSDNDESKLIVSSVPYEAAAFDKAFFESLGNIVKQEIEQNPNMDLQKVSLILPDQLFLTDTVTVPVIHRKAMQQSLSIAVESLYQNAADLTLMTYTVQQSKQAVTFGLVGVRNDILKQANDALDDAEAPANGITFAANAMVNGAMALNAKLRGDSFLLLDVKRDYARFAFVVRGCTMGYYDLPFGYGILHKSHVVSEDTLFGHRAAKLLVHTSKEKARDKQQTPEGVVLVSKGADAETGRKLPKFMQRSTPLYEEEFVYENFRVFLKWAQELINNNQDITSLVKIDTVYINMPDEYHFLFDIVSKKQEGRDVAFAPLLPEGGEVTFAQDLELYGGFFTGRYNEANTF